MSNNYYMNHHKIPILTGMLSTVEHLSRTAQATAGSILYTVNLYGIREVNHLAAYNGDLQTLTDAGFVCLFKLPDGGDALHIIPWFQYQPITPNENNPNQCFKPECVAARSLAARLASPSPAVLQHLADEPRQQEWVRTYIELMA